MKICILHATAGVGHQKAGEAIYQGLKDQGEHDVVILDALDYTHALFKKSYVGTYAFMATKMPWLWARAFDLLDIPSIQPLVRFLRRVYNGLNTRRLERFLKNEQFDWIITTHFLPTEVCNHLKGSNQISSKILTMVTDYDAHHIWFAEHVDIFTTPSDLAKTTLIGMGVPACEVVMTGMPVDKKFTETKDVDAIANRLGIDLNRFTLLITTSSFGFGPIVETVNLLREHQLLVVCGRNEKLYQSLKPKEDQLMKVFRFVDNMHELMAVSDVIITKAGGLTVSESLVSGLPMVFFTVIPGQEEHNVRIMEAAEVGFKAFTLERVKYLTDQWSSSVDALSSVKKRVRAMGKPDAVKTIISLLT